MSDKVAVFAVFYDKDTNTVAATTRPEDSSVKVGLPGGKVDSGETYTDALFRECKEEGWDISESTPKCFHSQEIEGFNVFWFLVDKAVKLSEYKEKHRGIIPEMVDIELLANDSTYGNDCLRVIIE